MKFPAEFDYYGGLNDLARAIKADRSTVGYWRRTDKIPKKREKDVLQAVNKLRSERASTEAIMDEVRAKPQPQVPPPPLPPPPPNKVRLSDIVDMIADYMRERGM